MRPRRQAGRLPSDTGTRYAILVFDPKKTLTGEHPLEQFLRQFDKYRAMREQVGASAIAELRLSREEETALWSVNQADGNEEPCLCGTEFTCLAKHESDDQAARR